MNQESKRRLAADLVSMTKPRIAAMVLMTTLVGYLLGVDGPVDGVILAAVLVGVLFMGGASSVFNQILEKEFDARMPRTKDRPLPAGRVTSRQAFWFGLALTVSATFILLRWTNLLTTALTIGTLLSYLFIYTPLKRKTAANTIVGAIPGAMPPVLGCAAANGTLNANSFALFAILFLWQLPHFLSIAWLYREDYARGGFRMLSLHDETGQLTGRQMCVHCLGLIFVSFLPFHFQVGGWIYMVGVQVIGAVFLTSTIVFWMRRTRKAARMVLTVSLLYLPVVFVPLALSV